MICCTATNLYFLLAYWEPFCQFLHDMQNFIFYFLCLFLNLSFFTFYCLIIAHVDSLRGLPGSSPYYWIAQYNFKRDSNTLDRRYVCGPRRDLTSPHFLSPLKRKRRASYRHSFGKHVMWPAHDREDEWDRRSADWRPEVRLGLWPILYSFDWPQKHHVTVCH